MKKALSSKKLTPITKFRLKLAVALEHQPHQLTTMALLKREKLSSLFCWHSASCRLYT